MRKLTIKVPQGEGNTVVELAEKLDAKVVYRHDAHEHEVVTLHLNNKQVSEFLEQLRVVEQAEIVLVPRGIIALYPPSDKVPGQVTWVAKKSPIEIYMSGLQSVGSRKGMVGYAIAAGAVVWIGLYTNTMYLLTAAMLIAPFAGPAMNTAIATTSGDASLLKNSLIRYFVSIGITIATTFTLSLIFQLEHPTPFMASISQISQVTALLPLVAGMAGAINQIQSERDSLVSGAAVGVLVAASLAPPAGIAGMAAAIGRWDMVQSGLFLLLLQLAGINLVAVVVFRFYGKITENGVRFLKGTKKVLWASMAGSVLLLGGLMYWQFHSKPDLERSTVEAKVAEGIKSAISDQLQEVELVQVESRFTRSQIPDMNPVLCRIYFIRSDKAGTQSDEALKQKVLKVADRSVRQEKYSITPVFEIVALATGTGSARD